MFFSVAVFGQINVKDSLQTILRNDTVDLKTRFRNTYVLISRNSSPEEAELLSKNIVIPFIKKNWKNKNDQLSRLAELHLMIGICYRERGGDDRYEKEQSCFIKAVETAKESGNDTIYARCLYGFGLRECKHGDLIKGNYLFYQAIELYDKIGMNERSTEVLYVIALNFFQIKDSDGLHRVAEQMKPYIKKNKSKQTLYQYNVVQKMKIETALARTKRKNKQIDFQLVDTIMSVIRDNIYLVENYHDELSAHWIHGWAYYYLAKAFYEYHSNQTDSIHHYLDKALLVWEHDLYNLKLEASGSMELKVYICQLRAQTLWKQEKMQEAYKFMNESLDILNKLKEYQIFDEQRYVAYQFMADYYEKANRPADALKYYKLLKESEERRYESEKIQAINDMSAKYETEKKETRIQTLMMKNQTARRILQLSVSLIAVLLIALLFLIRFFKLRRKSLEQSIYESVLLTELKHNELEHNIKEKECLLQQYNDLELLSEHNEQMAQSYRDELKRIKQQLEQKPTKTMISKLTEWLSKSVMEKGKREKYIQQLADLDIDMLEQGYLSADEKISNMEMKYIICFSIDMDVKDISLLFNVEPSSIRTVRYRIKKKFGKKNTFKFLM